MSKNDCEHTREAPGQWVVNPYYDNELNGYYGEPYMWSPGHGVPTTVDIDLHLYKCTQCEKVMYYSERARKHFEDGEHDPMIESSNSRYNERNRA